MRPGRAAEHSAPSSAAVMEEHSYTSTHPLGHTGPVTGALYLYLYIYIYIFVLSIHKTMCVLSIHVSGLVDFALLSSCFNFGVVILTGNA